MDKDPFRDPVVRVEEKLFREHAVRIAKELNERDAEKEARNKKIAELYEAARKAGLVPKVLREVIKRNRTATPEELTNFDGWIVEYQSMIDPPILAVLAMAREGKSVRQIAKETGVSKSVVARDVAVPGKKNGRDSKSARAEVSVNAGRA